MSTSSKVSGILTVLLLFSCQRPSTAPTGGGTRHSDGSRPLASRDATTPSTSPRVAGQTGGGAAAPSIASVMGSGVSPAVGAPSGARSLSPDMAERMNSPPTGQSRSEPADGTPSGDSTGPGKDSGTAVRSEEVDYLQPDEYVVDADLSNGTCYVSKLLTSPNEKTKGHAQFLRVHDGKQSWSKKWFRTRPLRRGEVVRLDQRIVYYDDGASAPASRKDALQNSWTVARVTDLYNLFQGTVTVGGRSEDVRLEAVRAIVTSGDAD